MNYYERHLGDYARDTAHLSLLEHGVYTILLDRYYVTEQGIPDSQKYRLARARTEEERAAVDVVLYEFFTLVEKTQEKPSGFSVGFENEKVWINNRADEEIAKAQSRINTARENGKKGGRPSKRQEKTQEKPSGFSVGFENETQQKAHQTPDTNHQSPDSNLLDTHNNSNTVGDVSVTAGSVCVELRKMGMMHLNPQHAELLNLIASGVSIQDFISAGSMAIEKNKGFPYALGIVKSRIQEKQSGKGNENENSPRNKKTKVDSGFAEKYSGIIQ